MLKRASSSVMHDVLRPWDHIPRTPERIHFILSTERNTDVCIHWWENTPNQDIAVAEMLDNITCRMKSIHHDKVGVRIDRLKGAGHSLIKEFLTIIHIPLDGIVKSFTIRQRSTCGLSCHGIDAVLGCEPSHLLNCSA